MPRFGIYLVFLQSCFGLDVSKWLEGLASPSDRLEGAGGSGSPAPPARVVNAGVQGSHRGLDLLVDYGTMGALDSAR
jgi:hypothetical protein